MEIRAMRHEERELVLDLLEEVFSLRSRFALCMDADPLYAPEDFLLALDAGRPVSCVQTVEKRIYLAGEEIRLGGISSVATHPDYRGRGLASRLLADSEERMRRRGMPLALLFTARAGFYAQHGWIKVPMDLVVLRRWGDVVLPADLSARGFRDGDLESVRMMYARQNADRPGSTIRSESYWRGQLCYAGTPDEQFRIAERSGKMVAYARLIQTTGLQVMEHACLPDETRALVWLILAHCPEKRRVFIRSPPATLEKALAEAEDVTLDRLRDPSPMWRVLDPVRLSAIAGQDARDETLIAKLIRDPRAHFWLSDRF